MVVSKDNKRKRNKSPVIESSPEMPKRTKVQAQRKFAQGQSAPTSTLPSTSGIASSSQPATSTEPPTDLLPNKRPKTEDFLTFLCFRGTSALPAHLDFLNQNASTPNADPTKLNEDESPSNKTDIKTPGKTRTSHALSINKKDSIESSTSTQGVLQPQAKGSTTSVKNENNSEGMTFPVRKRAGKFPEGNRKTAIRGKRSGIDGKSSRRSLRVRGKNNVDQTSSEQEDEKDDELTKEKLTVSNSKTIKMNPKKSEKNPKLLAEGKQQSTKKNLENECKKNINESPKMNKGKRKSSKIPFIETDLTDSKNKNIIDSTLNQTEIIKGETLLSTENSTKDKLKRLKKESPIFLPTTEASGRMTRQRAFFEPVKVSSNDGNNKKDIDSANENEKRKVSNLQMKSKETKKGKKIISKENAKSNLVLKAKMKETPKKLNIKSKTDLKSVTKISPPLRTTNKKQNLSSKETNKTAEQETLKPTTSVVKSIPTATSPKSPKKDTKSGMEIFEFSSDDEEPLAKSIQAKKKSPTKASRVSDCKKNLNDKCLKVNKDELITKIKSSEKDPKVVNSNKTPAQTSTPINKTHTDKKVDVESEIETQKLKNYDSKEDDKTLPKLRSNPSTKAKNNKDESEDESLEHIREKVLAQKQQVVDPAKDDLTVKPKIIETNEVVEPEKRSSRPTRKTKEAATIYMGLIGEKLNSSYFEDDNVSMDSFPDLPNVKETEKMETELKKNVGEKKTQQAKTVLNQKTPDAKKIINKNDVNETLKRKGRPAKNVEKNTEKKEETIKDDKNKDETSIEIIKQKEEEEEDEDFLLSEEVKETKRKLEHSFSDSDDEPLAIKVNKTGEKDSVKSKTSEPLPVIGKSLPDEPSKLLPISSAPVTSTASLSTAVNNTNTLNPKPVITPMEQKTPSKIEDMYPKNVMPHYSGLQGQPKVKIPQMQPARYHAPAAQYTPPMDVYPTPKINPNFLTPKFDRNLGRGHLESTFPVQSTSKVVVNLPSTSTSKVDSSQLQKPSTSITKTPTTSADPLKDEIGSILAANLMPSKEESGKIFGIASVSLAQSSGPDNTKCTLGKCGSIHKPVLGPVVPTETHLTEQLTSKERRKAKVNMTHEQIQKWLIECSSNPDEIHDDFDDDYESGTPPPPLIIKDDKESTSLSSSSKTNKDVGKSEGAWSGKGPSLRATPVVKDSNNKFDDSFPFDSASVTKEISISPVVVSKGSTSSTKKKANQTNKTKQQVLTEEPPIKPTIATNVGLTDLPKVDSKEQKAASLIPAANSSPQTSKTPSKKSTVYNNTTSTTVKDGASTTDRKKTENSNSFSAFSANNEKSIYSFDKEDDDIKPLSQSFRRPSQRETSAEDQSQGEKTEEKAYKDPNQTQTVSVTLSPEENMKMISVSLDLEAAVAGATVDQPLTTELHINDLGGMGESDSEGHTFYIPLQGTGVGGVTDGNSDAIQGVAVKIGREGSDGPNQKLIMHATLLTKGVMGANTIPIPESMNVSEIVKKLLSKNGKNSTLLTETVTTTTTAAAITSTSSLGVALNSIVTSQQPIACSSKSVPVGTVQPRFKSDQNQASGSGLQRVNSNSSLFSGSTKSRGPVVSGTAPKKSKDDIPIKMSNNTAFPHHDDPAQMVEAPVFRPTDKEFQDPIEFIERITPIAARFGICKIIPPSTFKPECRVSDDMRFTAYNQYVHKMLHRWGPSAKELSAIKKYLATQNIAMNHPPWIGGMEVDLPRLYHTVQELGGLKEVIEKKKWARVAEEMWIPKTAQDRVTKLDDIYCKYLLPYDTLSPNERQKLFDEVEADWAKREARARRNADRFINTESVSNEDDDISSDDEEESEEEIDGVSMECIVKGRSMPLSQFFRIARNTMSLWFKNTEPTVTEIEAEFWRHVAVRDSHVCVHAGSIDSSGWGYGFPSPGPKGKGSSCARHPWNLKVLTNNSGSVLRSLGPVMGVTVPTLHVGMLFSACCWYRDPHGLSWIEYLHTGASKIWYGIPDDQSLNFRAALTSLIPTHCQNKTIWLPCDTVMVPPHMLTDRGVSLCRTEQKPGEFVVIFPRAYTSSVSTGYVVSESVYFATSSWLELAKDDFKDIHDSCEPAMFSLEQLLFALASDQRVVVDILKLILPLIGEVFDKEIAAREQLKAADVISMAKVPNEKGRNRNKNVTTEENECDLCRANLYISMVKTDDNNIYCLQHALKNLNKGNIQAKQCKLIYTYTIEDIENLISSIKDKIAQKKSSLNKKSSSQLK